LKDSERGYKSHWAYIKLCITTLKIVCIY
jgi:hypothetical protein